MDGVSENVVYPIVANGFADHYPVFKWLFHWEYTLFFRQTHMYVYIYICPTCSSYRWLIIQAVLVVRKTAMGIRVRRCYNALGHPNRYTIK